MGETEATTGPADPLAERLDALASALAALDGGAVMQTLSRMEHRDIHALSALDTFATALRSVSQHLSHVRQAVAAAGQHGTKLDGLAERLREIEGRLAERAPALDLAPLAATLDAIGNRLAGLESKLDAAPSAQSAFDIDAVVNSLTAIAERLVRVEAKVDRAAQQPTLEPEATSDMLATIAQRVSRLEDKVDSGVDGHSIAACLMAVDRRLSRIEAGLGMERPLPARPDPQQPPSAAAGTTPGASMPADGDEPEGRERVDLLLEQVFRVLAR